MKHKQFIAGFTLVELILYMGIFSILLLVMTSIFTSTLDSRIESQSSSDLEEDTRFLLYRFTHDIESAQSISLPASEGASGNTLQMTVNSIVYTYSLSGGNLVLSNNLGTNVLNDFDTTISNLNFLRLGVPGGHDTITISFIITSKTIRNGTQESKNFKTTVGLQ